MGTDAAQFLNNSFHRNNSVNGTRDMAEAKKKKRRGDFFMKSRHGVIAVYSKSSISPFGFFFIPPSANQYNKEA